MKEYNPKIDYLVCRNTAFGIINNNTKDEQRNKDVYNDKILPKDNDEENILRTKKFLIDSSFSYITVEQIKNIYFEFSNVILDSYKLDNLVFIMNQNEEDVYYKIIKSCKEIVVNDIFTKERFLMTKVIINLIWKLEFSSYIIPYSYPIDLLLNNIDNERYMYTILKKLHSRTSMLNEKYDIEEHQKALEILPKVSLELKKDFQIDEIYVHGSLVKGDANEYSDLDLIFVTENKNVLNNKKEILNFLKRYIIIPIDLKIFKKEDLEDNLTIDIRRYMKRIDRNKNNEEELIQIIVNNKELVVSKVLANFLKKCLIFIKYYDNHDRFKEIVFSEDECRSEDERIIKSYYDALTFLMGNINNHVNKELLKKFFYIFLGREFDYDQIIKIQYKYFELRESPPIKQVVDLHLYIYEILDNLNEKERFLISIFFLNFMLASNKIPCIQILISELKRYTEIRDEYFTGYKTNMYLFLIAVIKKHKFYDKEYCKNLKLIDTKNVYNTIKNYEQDIKKMFNVKTMVLFGSFAKATSRIDSDIDLAVTLSQDLLHEEKAKMIENLTIYLYAKFNRQVDIRLLDDDLEDKFISNVGAKIKRIF